MPLTDKQFQRQRPRSPRQETVDGGAFSFGFSHLAPILESGLQFNGKQKSSPSAPSARIAQGRTHAPR